MKREKCDLVIKGAQIFNVFTGQTEEGDIAVADGKSSQSGGDMRESGYTTPKAIPQSPD